MGAMGRCTAPGIVAARASTAMEHQETLLSECTRSAGWRYRLHGVLHFLGRSFRHDSNRTVASLIQELPQTEAEISRSAHGPRKNHGNVAGILITFLLLAVVCLRLPTVGIITWLDSSWSAALIHAFNHRLQFGEQIVHSYGPLGFLSINWFDPGLAWPRIFFDLVLCVGVAAGITLVAWRMKPAWRVVFLCSFVLLSASAHWPGDELWFELGLISWGLLSLIETARPRGLLIPLLILAVVAALVKFTLLIFAALTISVVVFDLAVRGKLRTGAGLMASFALGFGGGWILLGQHLPNLASYIASSLTFSSGYNQSMGTESIPCAPGLFIAGLALTAVVSRGMAFSFGGNKKRLLRQAVFSFWLAAIIFLKWKHGFVRADGFHFQAFLGIVPMIGLMLEVLPAVRGRSLFCGRSAAVIGLASAVAMTFLVTGMPRPDVLQTITRFGESARNVFLPGRYVQKNSQAFNALRESGQLPRLAAIIGDKSVDVFGQIQLTALFNDLNYQPRPIFQSYAAYNKRLMALNDQFYRSQKAPEFVLFDLTPIDHRFPALEDAMVLRHLLLNYELVDRENRFLLLRRKTLEEAELTLIQEGDIATGEPITLTNLESGRLWMQIELKPTFLGKLRQLVYKPPLVVLGAYDQRDPEKPKWYRAPASMLAAGFLASPLIGNNEDVVAFYNQGQFALPSAYSVAVDDPTGRLWRRNLHFRIFRLEKAPKHAAITSRAG